MALSWETEKKTSWLGGFPTGGSQERKRQEEAEEWLGCEIDGLRHSWCVKSIGSWPQVGDVYMELDGEWTADQQSPAKSENSRLKLLNWFGGETARR